MSWMLKQFAAAMLIIAAGLCASAWGQASAPATRPSTQTASSDMSSRPVGPSEGRQIESGPQSPWTQWFRTLAALALVVLLTLLILVLVPPAIAVAVVVPLLALRILGGSSKKITNKRPHHEKTMYYRNPL